jgi:hypothetical protein
VLIENQSEFKSAIRGVQAELQAQRRD